MKWKFLHVYVYIYIHTLICICISGFMRTLGLRLQVPQLSEHSGMGLGRKLELPSPRISRFQFTPPNFSFWAL